MKISELLTQKKPLVSFEFFPPKTDDGLKNLMETISSLKSLEPSFVSMTYGAGGSTRSKTIELVSRIKHDIGLEAAAHLTCVGHNQDELQQILREWQEKGIENILALRGDPPKGETQFNATKNGFRYASQLVGFIRRQFQFCIGVAGYPEKHIEAPSLEEDILHLKEKVSLGGDFVVTQLFFDNKDYFSFVDRLRVSGITAPVIAGIMPITDFEQVKRFTLLCGARIPAELMTSLEKAGADKDQVMEVGIHHAVRQCRELLKRGVPGLHFYTLNKSRATQEIFRRLKQDKEIS